MGFLAEAGQTKLVPPKGDPQSKICIIGEAPGAYEVLHGEPFYGGAPAGSLLETCLHAAGLIKSECYLTNLFKHRINKKTRGKFQDIYHPNGTRLWLWDKGFTEAGEEYVNELGKELRTLGANCFVPLGTPALDGCCGRRGIYSLRGSIIDCTIAEGRKAIPTIHPAAALQHRNFLARYYIINDLKRIKEEAKYSDKGLPKQQLITRPTQTEAIEYLKAFKHACSVSGCRLNYDIELRNQEIGDISFAIDYEKAISIHFDNQMTPAEELEVWEVICEILEHPKVRVCNQNLSFDNDCLICTMGIIPAGTMDDPMVACGIMYPDFPKSLEFITSIWTRTPYYKDEGKKFFKGKGTDIEKYYEYSCLDSLTSWESVKNLKAESGFKKYKEVYEQTMRLYPCLQAMMYRGMKVNQKELLETKAELEAKRDELQEQLDEMVGGHLNVKSYQQKNKYFYEEKNIKPYLKDGRPTTDEKAMARLAKGTASRAPIPEAQLVVDITKIRSAIEKYYNIDFDSDSRLRCQINPRGTTTGRLSTGIKIRTNTGANMQNLPEDFKRFLVADEGYVLFEIDKRQAEWVVVAYYGGDANMIRIIEDELDPHATTGSLITGINDIDLIKAEAKLLSHETNPEVLEEQRQENFPELIKWRGQGNYIPRNMTIRQVGKKSNHGGNYGMGYKRAALEWEVPEYEAKQILPLYHRAYPGVENGFQAGIVRSLSKDRSVTNCFGRRREFLNRIDWNNTHSKVFEQAFGFLPQSTVADLINRGMIDAYEDTTGPMAEVEILAQVHDSILFQYPYYKGDVLAAPRNLAKCILYIADYLNPELEYNGRRFKIKSDLKVGTIWGTMKEVEIGTEAKGLAHRLSQIL